MNNTMNKKHVWISKLLILVMALTLIMPLNTNVSHAADGDRTTTFNIADIFWYDEDNIFSGYQMNAGTKWDMNVENPGSDDLYAVFDISMQPGSGSLADGGYMPEVVVGSKTYSYSDITANGKVKVLVKGNSTATMTIQYPASTPTDKRGYNYVTVSGTVESAFDGEVLGTRDNPTKMKFDTFYGLGDGTYTIYTGAIVLKNPAKITVETNGDFNWGLSKYSGDHELWHSDKGNSLKLPAGTYYLSANGGGGRQIKVKKVDFNWGSAKLTQSGSTITFKYTPASSTSTADANATYIASYHIDNRNSGWVDGQVKEFKASFDKESSTPGWQKASITVTNPDYGDKVFKLDYKILPKTPILSMVAQHNQVKVLDSNGKVATLLMSSMGDKLQIQQYKGSAWKTIKTVTGTSTSVLLKSLKSNTTYKYRFVGVVPAKNGKPAVKSKPSKTHTIKTGVASKPSIASVKITGAKSTYHPRVPESGYWDAFGEWHRTAAIPAHYTTSYKITVTLKSRAKGPAGLVINGKFVKGTGKTYSMTESSNGKLIGKTKKVTIKYYNSKTYGGYSPSITKSATVRK